MSSNESGSDESLDELMSSDYSIESPSNKYSKFQPTVSPLHCNESQMNRSEHEFLKSVWKVVWDHDSSWPFRKPIDEALPNIDLSHYHRIIRSPMDLETIRLRLKNRFYEFADECVQDFKTIFTNCYVYYTITKRNKDIFEMGTVLRDFFLKRMRAMPQKEIVRSKLTDLQKKQIFFSIWENWTLKLEDVPEDELRIIFSFLNFEDLKNLKLASKKCAWLVTQCDRRLKNWSVILKRELYSPIVPEQIFETLNYASQRDHFANVDISLCIDTHYDPEMNKMAVELCKDNLVDLDVWMENSLCQDGDDDELLEDVQNPDSDTDEKDDYFAHVTFSKLKKISVKGCTCGILRNEYIAETVTLLKLKEACSLTNIKHPFPNLEYVYCYLFSGTISKLISPLLSTLIVMWAKELDYEKVPKIPTLKKLIVDASSVGLLYKCYENVEDLTFAFYEGCEAKKLIVPDDLICPKLRELAFGQNCPPNWKFVMNNVTSLKMLIVPGMLNKNDPYPFCRKEFDYNKHAQINSYDISTLNAIMQDSTYLHTLVLPSNLNKKVRDDSGKVKIFFSIQEAAKELCLITRFLYRSEFDRYY